MLERNLSKIHKCYLILGQIILDVLVIEIIWDHINWSYILNNSSLSSPIEPMIKLIQDLLVIYIMTKFGANWSTFADARV